MTHETVLKLLCKSAGVLWQYKNLRYTVLDLYLMRFGVAKGCLCGPVSVCVLKMRECTDMVE